MRRVRLLRKYKADPQFRALTHAACAADPVLWVNDWVWTYDPRQTPSIIPFDLFPRQEEFLRYLERKEQEKAHGLAEKSRDVGFTWLCVAFAVHRFLFRDGAKFTFGSRKEMLVDQAGNPDSIFEKCRFILDNLPEEMKPRGYNPKQHSNHMRLINPEKGNTITGEAGDNMGRGGRSSVYLVDEAAFIERADKVDAAISNNSDVIIYVSTANGTTNSFYRKRMSGAIEVFTFHWTQDPRKGPEWYQKMVNTLDPLIVAQEIDIDYAASVDGIVIPRGLVDAACSRGTYESERSSLSIGVDVARFGSDASAVAVREGRNLLHLEEWRGHDLTETTGRVIALAERLQSGRMDAASIARGERLYIFVDSTGIGAGVADQLRAHTNAHERPWQVVDVDAGSRAQMSDPKLSRKRDELWWKGRLFFQEAEPAFSPDIDKGLLSKLAGELSAPTYRYASDGSLKVEGKDDMKKRGVPSPNLADAFLLTFDFEAQKPEAERPKSWRDKMKPKTRGWTTR